MTPEEIIRRLGLVPHPEGGHFRETFRDPAGHAGGGAVRPHSTAIYYLLKADERSHWHRIDAVEIWHHHAGSPLRLGIAEPGKPATTVVLGRDLAAGQQPQAVVPRGAWQAAEPIGGWVLVGCTVAPAFEFAGFELAPPGWSPD